VLFAKEVALVPDTTFEASQKKVRFAKQVTYISDINFEPSRHQHKYLRGSPRYSAGKHANPDGRAWRNTSFMSDAAYRLRSLKLFEYIDVTSGEQGDKSIDSYNKMMSTGTPLDQMFPNSDTAPLIGDHPLCDESSPCTTRRWLGGPSGTRRRLVKTSSEAMVSSSTR
jgi:hypothetical protein